ncbi:hypothetical protein LMG28727_07184 [Paraburkholderia kirstenboschensis]|nr:hypothetical protein LMG28727_07184 [Paraburkholderia kirstenboschensis]
MSSAEVMDVVPRVCSASVRAGRLGGIGDASSEPPACGPVNRSQPNSCTVACESMLAKLPARSGHKNDNLSVQSPSRKRDADKALFRLQEGFARRD